MPTTTMTSKGQVTIPKEIRKRMRLKPGDRLDFVLEPDGRVSVHRADLDIEELEGVLHQPGRKPISVDEMNGIIRARGGDRTE